MKLYHGSNVEIEYVDLARGRRGKDFGKGFYVTTSYEQAEAWVKRRMSEKRTSQGYVCVYELDEVALQDLKTLIFEQPTEEWVDFVMKNRTQKGYIHEYDIVYGPVANDRVYAAFALYEGGLINKQALIAELKAYKLVDQYLFHTERALQTLTFIEAKEVK